MIQERKMAEEAERIRQEEEQAEYEAKHKKSERTIFIVLGVFLLIIAIDLWFCIESKQTKELPYYLELSTEEKVRRADSKVSETKDDDF